MRNSGPFVKKKDKKKLTIWRGPRYFVIIDTFDGSFHEFDVFFRKWFVKPHKTAVVTSGVFDVGSSTIKFFFDWILDRRKG
jgi:hypothetical protein